MQWSEAPLCRRRVGGSVLQQNRRNLYGNKRLEMKINTSDFDCVCSGCGCIGRMPHLIMSLLGGDVQRRVHVFGSSIDVSTVLKQQHDDIDVAQTRSNM